MKNWKSKVTIIILFAAFSGLLLVAFDDRVEMVKGFLFFMLLMIASYVDIKTRTIPNIIHVLIMIVGLININVLDSLLGFIIVPLPFFIMAYIKEGSIGGGDVKLMAMCGFYYGLFSGFLGGFVGLAIAVLYFIVGNEGAFKLKNSKIALTPFFLIGYIFALFG